MPVSAGILGLIQCIVGLQEELVIAGSISGDNARTDGSGQTAGTGRKGSLNVVQQQLAAVSDLLGVGNVLHQHQKFIAADAAYNIIVTKRTLQDVGNTDQNLITE